MKVINAKDEKAVEEATKVLKKVGVIIYPAGTLYGLEQMRLIQIL